MAGPFVNDEYSDVYFALLALQAKGLPHRELVSEAERIRSRILDVPGVKKLNIIGEQRQRIYVELSYRRLATLGVGADAVLGAITSQNMLQPAGEIETPAQSVQLRLDGSYDDLDAVRNTPVAINGRVFRIGDIADIRRGYEDPASYLVRHDGAPALMLGVVMREQWNGTQLGADLARQVASIRAALPLGMTLTQVSDQSKNIAEAYGEFMLKFAVALAVVMIVSLLALGFRVGIVVACSVPLTLSAVFVIMLATGRDFDRITLGALILSLGLLVDDAIIAIEMMLVKLEEGLSRVEAATFAWDVDGSTHANRHSRHDHRLPAGRLRTFDGRRIRRQHLLDRRLLAARVMDRCRLFHALSRREAAAAIRRVPGGHDAIYDAPYYRRLRAMVAACMARRGWSCLAIAALLAAAALLLFVVPKQFFPTSDRPELLVEIAMPQGTSIAATTGLVSRLEADLAGRPEALSVDSYVGAGAPRFFLSLNPELPDPAFAKLVIATPGAKERDALQHSRTQDRSRRLSAGACARAAASVRAAGAVSCRIQDLGAGPAGTALHRAPQCA